MFPAQIRTIEDRIDLARTLFLVSSKSGTTLEANILKQYFFERAKAAVGAERAGSRFIAVTDPGSTLQHVAERDRFRRAGTCCSSPTSATNPTSKRRAGSAQTFSRTWRERGLRSSASKRDGRLIGEISLVHGEV